MGKFKRHKATYLRPLGPLLFLLLLLTILASEAPGRGGGGHLSVECATTATAVATLLNVTQTGARPRPAERRKSKAKSEVQTKRGPASKSLANGTGSSLWRSTKSFKIRQPDESNLSGSQLSITPRVELVRVPVESNAILKCLVSSKTGNRLAKTFKIRWSRFMYDENVYEQIEPSDGLDEEEPPGRRLARRHSGPELSLEAPGLQTGVEQGLQGGSELEPAMRPINRQQQLRDFLARSRQETNAISEQLVEATLSISPVKASDNATYYCAATDDQPEASTEARIDLMALSRPVVRLERVQPARDSKSALVFWLVLSDGNTPIKKTILMVRNDSQAIEASRRGRFRPAAEASLEEPSGGQQQSASSVVIDADFNQWQRIDISGDGDQSLAADFLALGPPLPVEYGAEAGGPIGLPEDNVVSADVDVTSFGGGGSRSAGSFQLSGRRSSRWPRAFNLSHLLPGVTYQLRLAAINDMGQSNWSQLAATMPNEIPAQISDVFLLSNTTDSLTVGWRRPAYDGAKTVRYEMQLFDLNRTLTLDANTNISTGPKRTNFMYYFVNLQPGTDYHFHVRACSRLGCSAFSSPKLLASTADGEPDEPLDVELLCEPASGNATVSWLPPLQPRGRLLNYSIRLEASAFFRNQSGQWTLGEWLTSLETADNHSLSWEAGHLLQPNTNYSVRVCAKNRSRQCGRLSQVSGRAQCQTGPQLPSELPAGTRLSSRPLGPSGQSARTKTETLVLDLPLVSWRNGSVDCIQVVLIRLPPDFDPLARPLSELLPDDPAALELREYFELPSEAPPGQVIGRAGAKRPLAYLAEELDERGQTPTDPAEPTLRQLVLGDGKQAKCDSVWQQVAAPAAEDGDRVDAEESQSAKAKPIQAFDGSLIAQTYYSGFLRLVQLDGAERRRPGRALGGQQRLQLNLRTRYSNYFSPVRTAELVPEVSMNLSADEEGGQEEGAGCSWPLVGAIQHKVGSDRPCNLANELWRTLRGALVVSYQRSSLFLHDHFRLDSIGRLIGQSSPTMQVLEVGLLVLVCSLLLLLVVYLITLPAAMRRRRRAKMRRQLAQAEEAAAKEAAGFHQPPAASDRLPAAAQLANGRMVQSQQAAQFGAERAELAGRGPEQVALSELQVQQQQQQVSYGTLRRQAECPVHSSPAARPAESVLMCRPALEQQQAQVEADHRNLHNHLQHQQHHLQHHQSHHNQLDHGHNRRPEQPPAEWTAGRQVDLERNCRTMRRVPANGQPANFLDHQRPAPQPEPQEARHLTMQHNSALALAKKINKSIPLSLFQAVLECRLRNGWLREEFEQLPRGPHRLHQQQQQQVQNGSGPAGQAEGRLFKLRPQLIVSRDDSISALISGNDHFDASLVKLQLPTPEAGSGPRAGGGGQLVERQVICARSPLDADSVWDFWRLIYEREVSTLVMLTPCEDSHTGELRCAQYWPTSDNEETTILSPCNEFVQSSSILPAKFKIRQETLKPLSEELDGGQFRVRRLTLMVMATRPDENEPSSAEPPAEGLAPEVGGGREDGEGEEGEGDEERLVIVERNLLHFQFLHWNASNANNQMRFIKFVELVNERHSRALQLQASPGANWQQVGASSPILVHCANGLGRSGLFAAMSFVIDELSVKVALSSQGQQQAKLNLFQLVAKLRNQRDLILSPYRFYELLYQLTARCIPVQEQSILGLAL